MPTFDEAKTALRDFHTSNGYELVDDGTRDLNFTLGMYKVQVPEAEIIEYQTLAEELSAIKVYPVETSIVKDGYREQLIEAGRLLPVLFSNRTFRFQNSDDPATRVEIGPPSPIFFNFFRARKEQVGFFKARLERSSLNRPLQTMRGVFERLLTIKFYAGESLDDSEDEEVTFLFESCLFELTYMRSTNIQLKNEWATASADRRRRFTRGPFSLRDPLPIKMVRYDASVVRFYQRAVGAEDAYIQFVSFYHVLEYYFISVSDRILYNRLSRLFIDPGFRPVPRQLDKIIYAVEEHKRSNDETEMLRNVLATYADEKDLIEFIERYESREKEKIYTDKSECFGEELEKIQLKEGHIFGPIAKRIKAIRNRLVHSSDRYERKQRYSPGPEADRVLFREIPLLRYIAERVIIATAQEL